MKIDFKNNQLNSLFDQLNVSKNKGQNNLQKVMSDLHSKARQLKEAPKHDKATDKTQKDRLELSDASKKLSMAQLEQKSILSQTDIEYTDDAVDAADKAGSVQAGGYNISFQFDMFYELTSKVEAQMGQKGAERFVNLGATVAETFKSSFNLSIDPVGSFMNGTQESLEISPDVTNAFFDSLDEMASLSPDALENFLQKSDDFFAELKKNYASTGDAFDTIKDIMQTQAKDFFAKVTDLKDSVLAAPDKTAALPPSTDSVKPDVTSLNPSKTDALATLLPGNADKSDSTDLISMFFNKDIKLSQTDYSDFLQDFQGFAEKIKGAMFSTLFDNSATLNKGGFNISA